MTPWKYKLTNTKTNEVHTLHQRDKIDGSWGMNGTVDKLAAWSGIKIGNEHPHSSFQLKFSGGKTDDATKVKIPDTVELVEKGKTVATYRIECLSTPEYGVDAKEKAYYEKHGHWQWQDKAKKEDD